MIVFMEIQPVIGVFRKDITRRNRRVSRYQCWNKLTGKTGVKARVKAESRPVLPEKEQAKLNASRIAEACFRPYRKCSMVAADDDGSFVDNFCKASSVSTERNA
jgi:hypothetical protein